ncbi:MAG: DUF1559 domain-containing protein [Rubripirellula sp.]
MSRHYRCRSGFTIIEIFGVVVIIGTLVGLLLPAVQSAREMARRTSCANNFTQVGMAVHAYHHSFEQIPTPLSGTHGSTVVGMDNDKRLSGFVALLPFLQQSEQWRSIQEPMANDWNNTYWNRAGSMSMGGMYEDEADVVAKAPWPAGGPEPFTADYQPWFVESAALRCPSDPGTGIPAMARTNYAFCFGDAVLCGASGPMKSIDGVFEVDPKLEATTSASMRGMFVPRVKIRLTDVTDGLSSTMMMGEIATALGDQDVRTYPAVAASPALLRDNPSWARQQPDYIDTERPAFWSQTGWHSGGANGMASGILNGDQSMRRGFRWADGMPLYTGCNTILPPNREITMSADRDDSWGILPPSSRHQGGAHVCFGDGRVSFVSNSIDAGDTFQPTVYPGSPNPPGSKSVFGVWGAMGTRASGELSPHELAFN